MNDNDKTSTTRWCILRTSGPSTLKLVASLTRAGFDAWTPTAQVKRLGRGRRRNEAVTLPAPITPTFVFADAERLPDLLAITKLMVSPHPRFAILRHQDRFPLISERSLTPLREAEAKRAGKGNRRVIEPGSTVTPQDGAWAGMIGKVVEEKGKNAIVNFGGGLNVTIASYLLVGDVLHAPPKPDLGTAA